MTELPEKLDGIRNRTYEVVVLGHQELGHPGIGQSVTEPACLSSSYSRLNRASR
ncbi:hypothetical protein AB0F43_20935 [Kribbella sp. NPDC023972]|uniref:hypothetical protein n=1 Tax=Kribbella sp. NPDC023972 TaxID=3154795 RepID=UPI003401E2FE